MTVSVVYIILFRGVGGATQLPTAPLREALTAAGFENVATYINSGNAVLKSSKSRETVTAEVAAICCKEFGFEKDIHVVTREEWRALIDGNPFPDAGGKFLHAAGLDGEPPAGALEAIRAVAGRRRGDRGQGRRRLSPHTERFRPIEICRQVRQGDRRSQHRAQLEHGAEADGTGGQGGGVGVSRQFRHPRP